MNQSTYRILLDIHNDSSQVILSAKKGDTIRAIYATLTERGNPYSIGSDCTAIFTAKKPDGNILYNNCVIEGNVIKYDVSPQTTSAIGKVECEFRLYGVDNELITSPRFSIIVSDTVYSDEDVIESTSEASALTELVTEANTVINAIETKYSSGEFNGKDGVDGKDGADGKDGTDGISCTHSWNGTALTVTSASGTSSADLKGEKGEKGDIGETGLDGVSPTISVSDISNGHRVSITDATGTHTFDVKDGTGASVTIDSELSSTSTNPLQNKIVTAALNQKAASSHTHTKSDLDSSVQESLGKADTALQSFTETDPTVPSWAKQSSKPTYTASEVGAAASDHTHSDKQSIITEIGILKGNGSGSITSATAGTDYATSEQVSAKQDTITANGILKGNGNGSISSAVTNTDYQAPITTSGILKGNGSGIVSAASSGIDYMHPDGSYINPVSINGTDLNTCITPGYYATVGSVDASTNNPFGTMGFLLEVIKRNDTIIQRATTYSGYQIAIRYMSIASGSWTAWYYQQQRITATGILKGTGAGNISAATANTDYLGPVTTGTWTPTLRGLTTAGSWSYTTRIGKYWKIDKMVYVMLCIVAYQSSAGAGELFCSLPITPAATATYTFSGSINFCSGGSNQYARTFRYFEFLNTGCTWRAAIPSSGAVYASDVASLGTGSSNQFTLRSTGWYICN